MQPPGGMTAPMKRGKPPDKGSAKTILTKKTFQSALEGSFLLDLTVFHAFKIKHFCKFSFSCFPSGFPIDHFGECKDVHDEYVACLKLNEYDNMSCRFLSKKYLKCRMDNQLMHPEKFERLGFTEKDNEMHPPRPPVQEIYFF